MMKINKISKKLIKPHTPTPQNLKNYHISLIDQRQWPIRFAVVLFYESKPKNSSQLLQESLSRILVKFYPLAGRYIKNDHMVDCSDQGVEFVEAEARGVELIDLVGKIETNQLDALLPGPLGEGAGDPILSVRATQFPAGGVAVAIGVSHRVFDASSLCTFVAAWSDATRPDRTVGITPAFDIPALLPHENVSPGPVPELGQECDHLGPEILGPLKCYDRGNHNGVGSDRPINCDDESDVKRFWFQKGALTSLRSKNNMSETISQVRVVCAIVAKALIRLDRAKHGKYRDFVIAQPVNMRERTISPLPKHSCGNFVVNSLTRRVTAFEAEGIVLHELAKLIGDSARKSITNCAEILCPNRDGRDTIINNYENLVREVPDPLETNIIVFTDWSKFGFYEADFGWGKPVWTSVGVLRSSLPFNNIVVLMSDKEGNGIEAWMHLNKNDVPLATTIFGLNISHMTSNIAKVRSRI